MKTIQSLSITSKLPIENLQPLRPSRAVWHFLLAGIGLRISLYHFQPFLLQLGLTTYEAFVVSFTVPTAILFALALEFVKQEGVPLNRKAMAARLRLKRPSWRDWGWMLGLFIIAIIFSLIAAPTRSWVLETWPALLPPSSFPAPINPTLQNQALPTAIADWLGPQAAGNWGLVALAGVMFFFNIFGEELYWRGLLFPQQELVHGRWTWLVHGLMWNLFHLPIYPWYVIYGLPITLAISFVAQKTKNTWMTIAFHALANLSMYGLIIAAVLGGI